MRTRALFLLIAMICSWGSIVHAAGADRLILGKKMIVKDPTGAESKRITMVLGKETGTDVPLLTGDPTSTGAQLAIVLNGTTESVQTFFLPAAGWSTAGTTGFKYSGPVAGEPVKKIIFKRTAGGSALLKILLKGNVGTTDLEIVPPIFGGHGGACLQIPGDDSYCINLGGAAGGNEVTNTNKVWKLTNPVAEPGPPVLDTCDCCTTPPSFAKVTLFSNFDFAGTVQPLTCEDSSSCTDTCTTAGQTCLGGMRTNTAYIGGGGIAVPPSGDLSAVYTRVFPASGDIYMKVNSCLIGTLGLEETTPAEAASAGTFCSTPGGTPSAGERRCTDVGCYFGPPTDFQVYLDPNILDLCGVHTISSAATGTLACDDGSMSANIEFTKDIFSAACPKCTLATPGVCGSGTCDSGTRAGLGCTPESPSLTSLDCPSGASLLYDDIGPFPAPGTTNNVSMTSFSTSSNSNIFCGWCFDGFNYGAACTTDAECSPNVCTAQSNGAFGHLSATSITGAGVAPGVCIASGEHPITMVDLSCLRDPSGAETGLPGPRSSSLRGTVELIP